MENPFEAEGFNANSLELWRRFLGLMADFPKETAPQPTLSSMSAADLLRMTSEELSAIPLPESRPSPTSKPPAVPRVEEALQSLLTPATPSPQRPPVASGLDVPLVQDPEQLFPPAASPPVRRSGPAVPPLQLPVFNELSRTDAVGFPSDDDPYGQDWRTRRDLANQRRYDATRDEMTATYKEAGELQREYRQTEIHLLRRMSNDLGSDFRQLLDISAAYESSRDTLTDGYV